jgi:hypothetical protein
MLQSTCQPTGRETKQNPQVISWILKTKELRSAFRVEVSVFHTVRLSTWDMLEKPCHNLRTSFLRTRAQRKRHPMDSVQGYGLSLSGTERAGHVGVDLSLNSSQIGALCQVPSSLRSPPNLSQVSEESLK